MDDVPYRTTCSGRFVEHLGDGGLDTLMGVRDGELDAAQVRPDALRARGIRVGQPDVNVDCAFHAVVQVDEFDVGREYIEEL